MRSFWKALVCVNLLLVAFAAPAHAAFFQWSGTTDDDWGNSSNWIFGAGVPGAGDDVLFSTSSANTTIDLNGDRSVLSASFANFTPYTLDAGGSFTLTLVSGDLIASGTETHTINSDVVLGADGDWDINNPLFEASRVITGNKLTKTGIGTLLLTGGDNTTPSSLATLQPNGGETIVDGARLDLTSTVFSLADAALTANAGDITLRNAADVRLAAGSFGFIQNATLTVTGSGTSLTGSRLDAAPTPGSTGSIVVEESASMGLSTLLYIGFAGDGDLTVQTGGTAASALGVRVGVTGSGNALVTGPDSVLSSSSDLLLGGRGLVEFGGTGTLTVDNDGLVQVADETKFWTSASSITIDGGTFETDLLTNHTGVTATVSISDPNSGTALTVGTNNSSSTFDGLIQDAAGGPGSLKKTGAGTFTLTGANTYTGGTIIDDGSIILDHANALQNSTVNINVNDGLNINGLNATIGGLAGSGNLDLGAQTLTAGGNNAPTEYSGTMSGAGSLTKDGTGTLELTGGDNTTPSSLGSLRPQGGETIVDGGRLDLTSTVFTLADAALTTNTIVSQTFCKRQQ